MDDADEREAAKRARCEPAPRPGLTEREKADLALMKRALHWLHADEGETPIVKDLRARLEMAAVQGPDPTYPPCDICGVPYAKHGTYPTCATHPYKGIE